MDWRVSPCARVRKSRRSVDGSRSKSNTRNVPADEWRSHFIKSIDGDVWKFNRSSSSAHEKGSGELGGICGSVPPIDRDLIEGQTSSSWTIDCWFSDQLLN